MKNFIDLKNGVNEEKLKEVSKAIKNGEIVVFPTETVYGIGTNALNEKAIKKLYEIKKRDLKKPISLLVSNIEMAERFAKDITDIEYKIMKEFFPGPLTIILKKKNIVPNIVTSNGDTVGIRMPEGEIAQKIIKYSNVPIATPSANISGKEAGTDIKQIQKDFGENVDYYIDGGKCKFGISSTIVKVINGRIYILREGSIKKKDIEKIMGYKCYYN